MKPIPFNPATDVAPIPFEHQHLQLARELKERGLDWQPHVGCFVWDPDAHIEAESPFPMRVYFILSLPRFIGFFGSRQAVADKLVWLPTWHQARLIALQHGVDTEKMAELLSAATAPGEELPGLYRLILETL